MTLWVIHTKTRTHTDGESHDRDTLADNETYPCDSDLMCPRTTVYNAVVITGRPTTSHMAYRQQFTNIADRLFQLLSIAAA